MVNKTFPVVRAMWLEARGGRQHDGDTRRAVGRGVPVKASHRKIHEQTKMREQYGR